MQVTTVAEKLIRGTPFLCYFDADTGFYKMGARYYDPHVGRFTQPEPAWSNPTFNTLGGRNLLVGRSYGAGATVGQGEVPLPEGYYRPGSDYNWYSYAGNDPINLSDTSGYSWIVFPVWLLVVMVIMVPITVYFRSFKNEDQEAMRKWATPSPGPSPRPMPSATPRTTPAPFNPWDLGPLPLLTPRVPAMRPAP